MSDRSDTIRDGRLLDSKVGEVLDTRITLVLVLTNITIIIIIIHIGGMIGDILWISSRRKIYLPLMER